MVFYWNVITSQQGKGFKYDINIIWSMVGGDDGGQHWMEFPISFQRLEQAGVRWVLHGRHGQVQGQRGGQRERLEGQRGPPRGEEEGHRVPREPHPRTSRQLTTNWFDKN